MVEPKVSIIMNCLSGDKYLKQALDSVFEQTYDNWEVIFWDNASTDRSAMIAKSYGDKVKNYSSQTTRLLSTVRNLAIKESGADFIAFLDCDDIWLPRKLEKQMPIFEKDPRVALVFSDMFVFDNRRDIYQYFKKNKPPRGMVFRELLANYFIGMASVVIRKTVIQEHEWFDERFNNIEDMDLFLRIAYSFKLDYVDTPLVRWRFHKGNRTNMDFGLFAEEWELLLRKLIGLYPNFQKDYSREIEKYTSKTMRLKILSEWLNHHPAQARKLLKVSGFGNVLRLSLFCLTFFPVSVFYFLGKLRFQIRGVLG